MTDGAEKKGLSPIAWIAIGCGALIVLVLVAAVGLGGFAFFKVKEAIESPQAAAETFVKLNPDLDLVESDEAAGTITFRNNKTGEVMTANFEDLAEGKFSITTDEGDFSIDVAGDEEGGGVTIKGPEGEARFGASASLENVPDWVPVYPGATGTPGTYTTSTAEGVSGMVTVQAGDGYQEVIDHYRKLFEDEGWEIQNQSTSTSQDGTFASITGELAAARRTLSIVVVEQKDETQVTVNYSAKTE